MPGGLVAKIADFGLAHVLSSTTAAQTKTKGAGTYAWMAPEVFDGHYSEASDVWAFGCVLYEIMTLLLPYDGCENQVILDKVKYKKEPPDFALVEDGCPPYMRDMAIACLAHDAAARPTFSELVDRLVAATPGAAAGGPVSTRRGGGTVDERFAAIEEIKREVEEVKRKQAEQAVEIERRFEARASAARDTSAPPLSPSS